MNQLTLLQLETVQGFELEQVKVQVQVEEMH